MADKKWENQLMDFIKRTGEELKRTGEEIKVEAQRLMDEVRDPSRQAKVKETLKELRDKATLMTKEAGDILESAVKRVEGAFEQGKADDAPQDAPAAGATPAAEPAPAAKSARKTGKSIGKKAGAKKAAATKKAPAAKKAAPKSIGRKKPKA